MAVAVAAVGDLKADEALIIRNDRRLRPALLRVAHRRDLHSPVHISVHLYIYIANLYMYVNLNVDIIDLYYIDSLSI